MPDMHGVKQIAKRAVGVLPDGARHGVVNGFHLLEAVAANARYSFPARGMVVIAVTGTNGKTTTASFVANILKSAGYKVGVCSTAFFEIDGERLANDLNATVSHPMHLQGLIGRMRAAGVTHLVLEVTSHALEQHRTWGIPTTVAVMTNLTQDHLDYHGTMERYAAAKAKLFKGNPRFVVLNHDDEWFEYFNQFGAGELKMTYGTDERAECRIVRANLKKSGSEVRLAIDHQTELDLSVGLPGKFNVYNAAAAVAACYLLHVPLKAITDGVAGLAGVPGRLERVDIDKPYDVIVDYAHTPDALKQLLETLKHTTKGRLMLVFGACGDRDKGKRPLMGEIAAELADRIFLTDEESYNEDPQAIRDMIRQGIRQAKGEGKTDEIPDRREAIAKAMGVARAGDTVVLTGLGHEQFRIENGQKMPWNDAVVVKEIAEV